jgi:hypothetical protein
MPYPRVSQRPTARPGRQLRAEDLSRPVQRWLGDMTDEIFHVAVEKLLDRDSPLVSKRQAEAVARHIEDVVERVVLDMIQDPRAFNEE